MPGVPLASSHAVAERYRIVRRLGAGGMATVFLAEDERLGRPVAIKRLHGESTEEIARRFRREARLGASLNHPNVVAIYDIASDDEGVLIVMEYVDGETLRDAIAAGPIVPARTVPILRAVAEALDHAHEHGVVHRDVKPANVLLRRDGQVKLADLGIATAAGQSRITKSGAVMGTAAYMPPERLDGGAGGPAADVYSLAAVAFEMPSGRKAVEGATPVELARRLVEQPPPDLRDALPSASPELAVALERGLAKDPAERHPSAGALVDDIAAATDCRVKPPMTGTTLQSRAAPRRNPAPIVAAALAVAAAIAALIALGNGDENREATRAERPPAAKARTTAKPEAVATSPGAEAPSGEDAAGTSPAAAVGAFYQAAATGDYAGAWATATGSARSQLGGYGSFARSQSTLESISFPRLRITSQTATSATVELRSEAVHSDRVDRCTGTVDLVRAEGGAWKLDRLNIAGCKQKRRK